MQEAGAIRPLAGCAKQLNWKGFGLKDLIARLRKKLAAEGRRLAILGDNDDTANRGYTKQFALARDRQRGRAHGLEYVEYFHHIPPDESDVEDFVRKNAMPL